MDAETCQELAPTGTLRATINLGNPVLAQRGPDGTLGGISVDLAQTLGTRLGVPVALHPFDTAGAAFAALRGGTCDVGFLAIDPARAEELDFTDPYVVIEGTYLVPVARGFTSTAEVDRPGLRIAAGRNSAYDLHLGRSLKHATLVHAPSSAEAIALFLEGGAEVAAGVRQPLAAAAAGRAGLAVLPDRFLEIRQAMALPKGRPAGAAALRAFVAEMKASGLVAASLGRSGQGDATVAP